MARGGRGAGQRNAVSLEEGGNEKLLSEIVWPHFWVVETLLFVLILVYCTAPNLRACSERRTAAVYSSDQLRYRHFVRGKVSSV